MPRKHEWESTLLFNYTLRQARRSTGKLWLVGERACCHGAKLALAFSVADNPVPKLVHSHAALLSILTHT